MKKDTINLILICIAYFAIGLILAGNYVHDRTIKITNDSIARLIMIEMITKKQFDSLEDRVKSLERKNNTFSQNN